MAPAPIDCDVLIIGAGFSGIAALHRMRQLPGLRAHIFEAGDAFGGTWHWNRYPGARVDSEWPLYQLNIPAVYNTWRFTERFPDAAELRRYFAHVADTLDLRRDTTFGARVSDCAWDERAARWTVRTQQGHAATARFVILGSGLLHHKHIPDFPGLADYGGAVYHSSFYPEDLDLRGKRVVLVGTGATGVQITQELAKVAGRLTLLMRRPSLCLPAVQRPIGDREDRAWKDYFDCLFRGARTTPNGFPPQPVPPGVASDYSPDERERYWEHLYAGGGFRFWSLNYADKDTSADSNRKMYEFWAAKTRARMSDPVKRDLMAPTVDKMPYHIFTKRPPLELDYYEMLDRPNVDIINTNHTPARSFNKSGLLMDDGRQIDFDVLILATGFDAYTGSMAHMGLKNRDGVDVRDAWADGIHSYLGLTVSGFPNVFMCYSPLAPTSFVNGTTMIEAQADMIAAAIAKARAHGIKTIEPTPRAEREWAAYIQQQTEGTLFPLTQSWWTGANIPGRKPQMLTYLRGLAEYTKEVYAKLDDWQGFDVEYFDGSPHHRVTGAKNGAAIEGVDSKIPIAEHVENTGQSRKEASEAVEILRPQAV